MSKKSTLIAAAAIAVLGHSPHAFAQSLSSGYATNHELSSHYGSNTQPRTGVRHDALAAISMTTSSAHDASCSDQIADLRKVARLNHQPTPETVWQAQTYGQLMFSADLALAEAQDAEGNNGECLLSTHHARQELQE
jgi:hypothetical protein